MVNKKLRILVATSITAVMLPTTVLASSVGENREVAVQDFRVKASESTALKNAKAKISHLTYSLKNNYLGIKNQGTWEMYIRQARDLISKIPSSEKVEKDKLTQELNRDEALVKALSRINQVEKSIAPKSEGGYGNYLGIKNAETWREYLRLASIDLEKVDKVVFKKQYDELKSRMNKVSLVVREIEDKFQVEYDKVVKLFNEAKANNDKEKAKLALKEAEKLGTCSRSDALEKEIKSFINKSSGGDNSSSSVSDIEAEVAKLVNEERAKQGLKPLELSSDISKVARIKSQDMADKNYFDHTSPTYGSPFDMMKKFDIKYNTAGENIAKGQTTAQSVMKSWMNSPGHRANILSSNFGKIGVGYVNKNGTTYWTQMFTN